MTYLIWQMGLLLLAALLLGFVSAWLLKGILAKQRKNALHTDGREGRKKLIERVAFLESEVEAEISSSVPVQAGSYDIEEIEGVGSGYGSRLRKLDISQTEQLASMLYQPKRLEKVAAQIDVDIEEVRRWAKMADLIRVPGIRGHFAELLEASGINSVHELAGETPQHLAVKMSEQNSKQGLTKTVPSAGTVATWIQAAKRRNENKNGNKLRLVNK